MVVFWKEDSRRQPQLSTPENGGGDDTDYPSPPNVTFFDDPDRQVRLVYARTASSFHHQQVVEKELKQEIHRLSDCTRIRDLHRLSLNLLQYQ